MNVFVDASMCIIVRRAIKAKAVRSTNWLRRTKPHPRELHEISLIDLTLLSHLPTLHRTSNGTTSSHYTHSCSRWITQQTGTMGLQPVSRNAVDPRKLSFISTSITEQSQHRGRAREATCAQHPNPVLTTLDEQCSAPRGTGAAREGRSAQEDDRRSCFIRTHA